MKYRRLLIFSTSAYRYGAERGLMLFVKWAVRRKWCEHIIVVVPEDGPLTAYLEKFPEVEIMRSPFPYVLGSDIFQTLRALACVPVSWMYYLLMGKSRGVDAVMSNTSFIAVSLPLAFCFPHIYFARECFPSKRVFTLYQRILARFSQEVVAVSSYVQHAFGSRRPCVVHEPLDAQSYHRYSPETAKRRLGLDASKKVIALVARIHPDKGQEEFIASLASLPEYACLTILIAGDISGSNARARSYKRRFLQTLNRASLRQRCVHLGYIDDIGLVYSASDICVFPYRRKEFYGFSLLEACFFKKNVVVDLPEGGCADYIDRVSGPPPATTAQLPGILASAQEITRPRIHFPRLSEYLRRMDAVLS